MTNNFLKLFSPVYPYFKGSFIPFLGKGQKRPEMAEICGKWEKLRTQNISAFISYSFILFHIQISSRTFIRNENCYNLITPHI